MPTRWVLVLFVGSLNFGSNAPNFRPSWGGMCILFEICEKRSFQKCMGGGGSETIFLHNRGAKLDVARIFSNLPAQLAEVCNPCFPVPGDAPTYR